MIEVGVVGATGYAGVELLRLLASHPEVRLRAVTSRQEAGKRVSQLFPHLRGFCELAYVPPDADVLGACQAVFFATPHGAAMALVPELLQRGARVIDLSADFRLRDAAVFQRWYTHAHACPELLAEAVYGLPEVTRAQLPGARLVACPGCYPTAVQLGLIPLLEAGAVAPGELIADCKSGVSGGGRELRLGYLYSEAADSLKAYGASGHRHSPEIEQGLTAAAGVPVGLTFVPHLTPMIRGIHATLYARQVCPDVNLQALFETRYRGEPFVDVLPAGEHPDTRSVRGSNHCRIAVHRAGTDRVIVLSVIDNLVKGAAGQAVQCFNLMFGLRETLSLDAPPLAP
jgi:N-acetyl-gamma-glutamyl-phosphate reductase